MTHLKHFINCVCTQLQQFVCTYAHSVMGHKMCGLQDLRSSPCQPFSCSVQQMREPLRTCALTVLDYACVCQCTLPEDRSGKQKVMRTEAQSQTSRDCLLQEVQQGVVLQRLSDITEPISAQPRSPRSAAIYKIPLWPSLWQGWMPILKSTISSSVHILEVPGDYVTALQA